MNKSLLLLFAFTAVFCTDIKAQMPQDNPCDAEAFCNTAAMDAYSNSIKLPTKSNYLTPKPFCGSIESPTWFRFIAQTTTLDLGFSYNGCTDPLQQGLQAMIFSAGDCRDTASFQGVSNCMNLPKSVTSGIVSAFGLVPGQTYFLLIDGVSGGTCNYDIDVLSGTIKSLAASDLLAPTEIYGPSQICSDAGDIFYSVPKNPNATVYNFNFNLIGSTGSVSFGGPQLDSFYTQNISGYAPIGFMEITVSYSNNCVSGPSITKLINIGTYFEVTLPPVTLKVGQTAVIPQDSVIYYGTAANNTTPQPTTTVQQASFYRYNFSGGCDTLFNVQITRVAQATGRAYILRPSEVINIGGTDYGPNANCTPRIITPSNDTIYNAAITNGYTPSNPTLNCDTITINVTQSGTCPSVTHNRTFAWYSMATGAPILLTGTTNSRKIFSPDTFRVIIRDSVSINGKPISGFKIYLDTLAFRVKGIGAAGTPTQPGLINNTLAITECQNNTATYSLAAKALNTTKYLWKILRGGGIFVSNGKDTVTSFNETDVLTIKWNVNTMRDTIEVTPQNECGKTGTPRLLYVTILNFPNLSAGNDTTSCNLGTNLSATSSTGTGAWATVVGNPSTPIFQNSNIPNTQVTVTTAGTYKFAWRESQGTCSKSDTVSIVFNTTPQVVANSMKDSCNAIRDSAFVRFALSGGTQPYNVFFANTTTKAGTVANGQFQSVAFKPGNYNLEVRDANNCSPAIIQGNQTCTACTTNPGTLQAVKLTLCAGDSARPTYLGGALLEPNDTKLFDLHTGDPRTGIIAQSKTAVFGFAANTMSYLQTYYISAIAADKLGNGIDLNDPCFKASSAQQVSVVFYRPSTVSIAAIDTNLCAGTCANILFNPNGNAPYQITLRLNDGAQRDTNFNLVKNQVAATYCPKINTSVVFTSFRDSLGCDYTPLSNLANIRITQPINAGKDTLLSLCKGIDTTFNLTNLLRGANVGGTWTESSSMPSTAGAFSAAAATFRTTNQVTATYKFNYLVKPMANSICPPDTAFITIRILPTPTVDAGVDKTITCAESAVTIGGNTQTGGNIVLEWSNVSGTFGGNSPTQEVRQADTYTLRATEGSCSATDIVIVYIDTASPRAIIAAITDSITCRRDTITINGSRSTPTGITYLWSYNGAPFDNNPNTIARAGGNYMLKVTNLSNGCSNADSLRLIENRVKPTLDIVKPGFLNCIDTILTLDASGSSNGLNFTLKWSSDNNGFYADSTTLKPQIDSVATYKLVIINTSNGCQDSTTVKVKGDYDVPIANAVATDSLDCFHPTVTLNARGSTLGTGISYTWIAVQGNIVSGENSLVAVIDQPGTYVFLAFNEINRCASVDTVVIRKNDARPESINFATAKPTCYAEKNAKIVIDTVVGGSAPFIYSLDGKVFTQKKTFTNLAAGDYRLYLQDAAGCTLDTLVKIAQDNQVFVSLGLDTLIKLGDSLLLSVNTNANSIKKIGWSVYTDSVCSKDSACLQQWVKPTRQTKYSVVLTDVNGCKTNGNVTVTVDKKRPVFIPNIFRPGSDGGNGIFMVFSNQVVKIIKQMSIFDRWGEQVFAQTGIMPNNPLQGWNGRFRDQDVQPGVYTYIVEIEYLDGEMEVISGTVTLVK